MKVIFLDIDGVLNSGDFMWISHSLRRIQQTKAGIPFKYPNKSSQPTRDEFGNLFDPRCVLCLKTIIEATDAKIVISSTWRKAGLTQMQKLWEYRNLPGEVIGITPSEMDGFIGDGCRLSEINEYLHHHPEITQWAIIDDDPICEDSKSIKEYVETTNQFGLDYFAVKKVISLLG